MPDWTTLTLAELRASTKAGIIRDVGQWMAANMSKREIIVWLMDTERIPDRAVVTRDDQGRIVRCVDVDRDPGTGDALGGRVMTWTYFATGEVRFITASVRDADNNEVRRWRIRHFRDGRQPVRDVLPSAAGGATGKGTAG